MLIEAAESIVETREILTFILALGGLLLVLLTPSLARQAPHGGLLVAGFVATTIGLGVSAGDAMAAPALLGVLNLLEHAGYATGAVLLATWTWRLRFDEEHP